MPQDEPPSSASGTPRLAGRVAVVTGASRGIGLSIAERLIADGAKVAITARNADALAEAIEQLGGSEVAMAFTGKADDPEHQDATLAGVAERFGPVDILVNNAGINPAYGRLIDLPLAAGRKILDVNVLGTLSWIQRTYAAGMETRGGAIINIASVAGIRPAPGISFYGVSKAAVIHLTAALAVELGPKIRVNGVAPAVVKTKFAEALYVGREAEVAAQYPLGRLGEPGDIAGAVAFLASDEASWITGQTFVLDGGVTQTGGVG
ncbi:3-oxoacyl-[acyl-carrier protein] reductase [Nakamurella sp. UYEF19]|uniref:SDR family oxidoreductase n=1 Tax=Nakamurella sp. UYEF19 TaxID=1756392 RepID=UPI0033966CC0